MKKTWIIFMFTQPKFEVNKCLPTKLIFVTFDKRHSKESRARSLPFVSKIKMKNETYVTTTQIRMYTNVSVYYFFVLYLVCISRQTSSFLRWPFKFLIICQYISVDNILT